jgi:PIN domain nuclease of toxin-antitoxin system
MTCLLDTHFLIWIVSESKRLKAYPWLKHYEPWSVSPVSFLEIQLLSEIGRGRVDQPRFTQNLMEDSRFRVDEISVVNLVRRSVELSWSRDPFDRLIAAHSLARRLPLCSIDQAMLQHHKHIVRELR